MPEYMRELHDNGFKRYLATGQRHINWQGTELTALRKNGEEFPVKFRLVNSLEMGTKYLPALSATSVKEGRQRISFGRASALCVN